MIIVRIFDERYSRLAELTRPHLVRWSSGMADDVLDIRVEPSPDLFIRRWPIIASLVRRFDVLALDVDVFPRHRPIPRPQAFWDPGFQKIFFARDSFGLCAGAACFLGHPRLDEMLARLPKKMGDRSSPMR